MDPETRPLLRTTGAAITAGFDPAGAFSWLDIPLARAAAQPAHHAHHHRADDLLHLVDAVATATLPDRGGIPPAAAAALGADAAIPDDLRDVLSGNVVAIQPGAADPMQQWPVTHCATLIDALIERHRMRVLLVGDAEAASIEQKLLSAITQPSRVISAIGKLSAEALPAILARCDLFVGPDGDALHLAAAIGIPTVGLHAGMTDPAERGPIGPRAVAVARAMTCSPCYLRQVSDCPRGLACLRALEPLAVYRACETLLARPSNEPVASVASAAAQTSAEPSPVKPPPKQSRRAPAAPKSPAAQPATGEPIAAQPPSAKHPAANRLAEKRLAKKRVAEKRPAERKPAGKTRARSAAPGSD